MNNIVLEDVVTKVSDIDSISEYEVKQDGVCLVNYSVYIIYLGAITTTNSNVIKHLDKLYINSSKSSAEAKRNFPLYIENGVIHKVNYLKDCDWFVIRADGYPLEGNSFNYYKNSGFKSFDEVRSFIKKFLNESVAVESSLVNQILDGGSVRDILL